MAKLNLNFHQPGYYEPTKHEIYQLDCIAIGIEAIVKAMIGYCSCHGDKESAHEAVGNCHGVFNALELLIEPIVNYMANYVGNIAAPEVTTPTDKLAGQCME
jgi:hypothetical protein